MFEFIEKDEFLSLSVSGLLSPKEEAEATKRFSRKVMVMSNKVDNLKVLKHYSFSKFRNAKVEYRDIKSNVRERTQSEVSDWKRAIKKSTQIDNYLFSYWSNAFHRRVMELIAETQVHIIWKYEEGKWKPEKLGKGKKKFGRKLVKHCLSQTPELDI